MRLQQCLHSVRAGSATHHLCKAWDQGCLREDSIFTYLRLHNYTSLSLFILRLKEERGLFLEFLEGPKFKFVPLQSKYDHLMKYPINQSSR